MVMDIKEAIKKCTKYTPSGPGKKPGDPLISFKFLYDAPTAQLEPIYFWILDFMQEGGQKVEKITDNFTASPGSGHFSEMGQRASTLLQQGMNALGAINQVIKSVIQLLYDLKEYEVRLDNYDQANSKDKSARAAGLMSLKQIWLDQVDIKKGNSAIKAMTFSQSPFATLIDAFMMVSDEKLKGDNGEVLDLNDRVKRVLQQRILEFNKWREVSEKEMRKRFLIEKAYLRSQVETIKLYTSWARPYLRAAEELKNSGFESKDFLVNPKDPALVNMFNTAMFELVLFGKSAVNFEKSVMNNKLPRSFLSYKPKRKYYSINVVSMVFRGIPQKVTQQSYGFGGRIEMKFDSYALNDDELKLLKKVLTKDDIETAFKFTYETTEDSLKQLQEDLDHFLDEGEEEKKEEKKEEKIKDPISALFSLFSGDGKKDKKKDKKAEKEINSISDISKDDYIESSLRRLAADGASDALYRLYDVYKKAHGHASSPESFDLKEKGA